MLRISPRLSATLSHLRTYAMSSHYDYLVIGGGSGGVASARRAAQYGAKTLLIEGNRLGGTCVNVGCVPKKVMWYALDLALKLKQAKEYGFDVDPAAAKTFNWEYFKPKRDAYIKRLNGIYASNLEKEGVEWIHGWAKFVDSKTVEVAGNDGSVQRFTADHILIATGGQAILPDVPGAAHGIDSDGFFDLEHQPKEVVVVGAGYIGVELAGVFHGLGLKTHLVIRGDTVLRLFDDIIGGTITKHYESEGIDVHKQSGVEKVEKDGEKVVVHLKGGEVVRGDALVWTVGRKSLLKVNLDVAGVKVDDKNQIVVDEFQNTNVEGIYSLGDVVGNVELTPVAIAAGRKLLNRLFGGEKFANQKQDYNNVPSAIFSHPEAGLIGLLEKAAREKYGDAVKVYNSRFTAMYYAMLEHKLPTVYKLVVVGPEEKVVGLHLVGEALSEILQGFGVAVKMGATKADFDNVVAIHPTSAEEIVTLR